ncbi:unnamed protein product, partial [Rhizoctonia solani]
NTHCMERAITSNTSLCFYQPHSQRQAILYIIVNLATPPSGSLTPFNGYVTLSRSQTVKTARLLQDFDDKLFTTPPSEHLALEDRRLKELDLLTMNKYSTFNLIGGGSITQLEPGHPHIDIECGSNR